MKETLAILLAIIAEQGPEYPEKNPYPTYTAMLDKGADARKARLVLLTLLAGIPEKARKATKEELVEAIQKECCLKSKPAESLATLYTKLYSTAQKEVWEEKKEEGFQAFCEGTWRLDWEGESTWWSRGVHLDCSASIVADVVVVDKELAHKAVAGQLKDNPFIEAEDLWDYLSDKLTDPLDEELEDYVTAEEFYEPYMEEFWGNTYLKDRCEKFGLQIVEDTAEYGASSGDYIPNRGRRW